MSLPLNLQSLLAQSGPKATPLNQVIPSVASAPPKSAPESAGKPIELTTDIVSINDRDVDSSARAVIADITKYNAAFKFRSGRSIACSRLSAPRLHFLCVLFPSDVQHCCAGILLTQYVMARCVLSAMTSAATAGCSLRISLAAISPTCAGPAPARLSSLLLMVASPSF